MIKLEHYREMFEDETAGSTSEAHAYDMPGFNMPSGSALLLPEHKLDYRKMNLERVLVVRLDSVGDVVMLSPALRMLRNALPDARITLLASPAGSQAAPLLPWIDDVIVSEALWQDMTGKVRFNPENELGLIEQIRSHEFSAAFIFTSFSQSPLPAAYACYLAGIPHRIGFSTESAGGVLSCTPSTPVEETHQADRNTALLEAIRMPAESRQLELSVSREVQEQADQLLESVGIKPEMSFILLAPGANDKARRYDPKRFASVARLLAAEAGLPVVITGSVKEAEAIQPVIEVAAEARTGNIHSLVGRTSMPELAAIIRRASLVVANNSAVMHIADAFQRPMVILYSGTEFVSQWMPRSARARLLCRPVFCAPCHHTECPYGMQCLDIRPDEVAIAALEMLAERFYFRLPVKQIGAEL
ncbi:MAG: glycosyltransferase family 9 protein [Bacteroidota bacterium]